MASFGFFRVDGGGEDDSRVFIGSSRESHV